MEIRKNNNGFTMVELLVTIVIFTAITLVIAVNFKVWFQQTKLGIAKDAFVDHVKQVQTYSLTGRICVNSEAAVCSSDVLPYGLGVNQCGTAPCAYWLFVDSPPFNNAYNSSAGELLSFGSKNFAHDATVFLQIKYSMGGYITTPSVDIVFSPFTAQTIINNDPEIKKAKYIISNDFGTFEVILDKESGNITETQEGGELINQNSNTN